MFKSKNSMSRALVRRETTAGYLFLLPSLFFFVTFVLYPMFLCIYTSFFDSNMGKNAVDVFVGLGNDKELFQDKLFLGALKNTVIIVVVAVPTVCAFSLWVATAIYDMKPALTSAFRCIFYLPVVTGSVAVTVVWKWMYNSRFGVFNYLFKSLGIIDQNINWLGDARFALWCIILILFTTSVGQPIVLYVSALGNVDHSLVEAAQVDGANRRQVFWKIKWRADHAHHAVHTHHHHDQLLPVLRADPAAHLRRADAQYGHDHVLHLLHRVQALPLRVRQRHGRCAYDHHRGALCCPVQAGAAIGLRG